tara:strand:+ start:333 stop:803 length:471 start_codon:yes stop_codon:yes gene_type:complete
MHNIMKKNRTFSSLKPIRSLLPENIKKLIKNNSHANFDTLKTSWKTVLGEDTAKKCKLTKIDKYNKKKCIFLKVDRQYLIEIDYARDEIIKKINSFFGYECINKILINFEDIPGTQLRKKSLKLNKKTKDMIETLNDDLLRDKLYNFIGKGGDEKN